MIQPDTRTAFEEWAKRTHRRPGTHFDRANNGTYKDNRIAAKWAAWQAATEAAKATGPVDFPEGSALKILRDALWFYADKEHFIQHQDVWESVSGEPENFLEDESHTATVEDGTVAKNALNAVAGYTGAKATGTAGEQTKQSTENIEELVALIVRDVSELEYDGCEIDAMEVTPVDLAMIVERNLERNQSKRPNRIDDGVPAGDAGVWDNFGEAARQPAPVLTNILAEISIPDAKDFDPVGLNPYVVQEADSIQKISLSDDQLDKIARSYFAEEWAQKHLKNAIHDAFIAARSQP